MRINKLRLLINTIAKTLHTRVAMQYKDADTVIPDFMKIVLQLFSDVRRYVRIMKATTSDININISAQTFIVLSSIFNKRNATNENTIIIPNIRIYGRIRLFIISFLPCPAATI